MRFLALVLFSLGAAVAAAEFKVPALSGPVVDEAGILGEGAERAIGSIARQLKQVRGTELAVVTVQTLDGMPIEQAALKIAEQWKLGDAKTDRGVLLLVAVADRRVRIEVGYGLEGELTDLATSRIIRELITPRFKTGDFETGIIAGVGGIMQYSDPDFRAKQASAAEPRGERRKSGLGSLIFFLILLFLMGLGGGGRRRSGIGGFLLGAAMGGAFRGGGGGGGSFGGGGGSWGGGGGGFGGGGSSGSW
jgi:uncharacterized protein